MNIEKIREDAARKFCDAAGSSPMFRELNTGYFISGAEWEYNRPKWVNVEDELPEQDVSFTKFNRSVPVLVQDEAGTVVTATISLDSKRWYIDPVPIGEIIRWTEIPKI